MQPGSGKLRFLLAATLLPAQPPPPSPPPLLAKLLKSQGNFGTRFSSRGEPGCCTPGQPRRETCPTFPPAASPACGVSFHLPPRRDLKAASPPHGEAVAKHARTHTRTQNPPPALGSPRRTPGTAPSSLPQSSSTLPKGTGEKKVCPLPPPQPMRSCEASRQLPPARPASDPATAKVESSLVPP